MKALHPLRECFYAKPGLLEEEIDADVFLGRTWKKVFFRGSLIGCISFGRMIGNFFTTLVDSLKTAVRSFNRDSKWPQPEVRPIISRPGTEITALLSHHVRMIDLLISRIVLKIHVNLFSL